MCYFQRCRELTLLFARSCKLLAYKCKLLLQRHVHSVALNLNCERTAGKLKFVLMIYRKVGEHAT